MIDRLRGVLLFKEPTRVVIDCGGVGYELQVPLTTSSSLPDVGAEAMVLVEMRIGRSGVGLYGFATEEERETFRMLTSVDGVGPRAGLNLLSRLEPAQIRSAIASGDVAVLRSVPGIGEKRTANILKKLQNALPPAEPRNPLLNDAEKALISLGLTRREARSRLERVKPVPQTLAELLRLALAQAVNHV